MPRVWRLEDGRFVLRGRSPLPEAEFAALAVDLARRQAAHGRGLRSTMGLAETVARRDRRIVEKLAEAVTGQGVLGFHIMRQVLKALRLGRLAQSVNRGKRWPSFPRKLSRRPLWTVLCPPGEANGTDGP